MRLVILYKPDMVSAPTKADSGSYTLSRSAAVNGAFSMLVLTLKHKDLDGIFNLRVACYGGAHY
jgi:hypothetical protein